MKKTFDFSAPRAISMWDFPWLERRWPGSGYGCRDTALEELIECGYGARRIGSCFTFNVASARMLRILASLETLSGGL